ncbi:unnamed protein product [Rhizopus stolonifer]
MSQSFERSQADHIKSLQKQCSTQEINNNNTQKVADTNAQEFDDESDTTTYFHEAHRLAYIKLDGDTLKNKELASLNQVMTNALVDIITSLVTPGGKYLKQETINSEESL